MSILSQIVDLGSIGGKNIREIIFFFFGWGKIVDQCRESKGTSYHGKPCSSFKILFNWSGVQTFGTFFVKCFW